MEFILGSAYFVILMILLIIILFKERKRSDLGDLPDRLDQILQIVRSYDAALRDETQRTRNDLAIMLGQNREELNRTVGFLSEILQNQVRINREELNNRLAQLNEQLNHDFDRNRRELSVNLTSLTAQINSDAASNREELNNSLESLTNKLNTNLQTLDSNLGTSLENLRTKIDEKLSEIRQNNENKLEEMRKTVDEKLQTTLETRLGQSFELVSKHLEQVHKGLGEMQNLATGVGDLKKVLSNVKNRGVMGEIQLSNLLEQILTPDQYETNFRPFQRRDEIVEFAIRLPGRDEDAVSVYLPIDVKFPIDVYEKMITALDNANLEEITKRRADLDRTIRTCAKHIRDKYINPPVTTDFALMFLPIEGLFAEVMRSPDLFETIRRDSHVIITGPTTLTAILNSFQMGFRTLAIEKRSSEVWKLLGAIKTEFGKFGEVLMHTQKKLQEAGNVIEKANVRTRSIQRRLRNIEELPAEETAGLLDADEDVDITTDDEDQG